MTKSIQIWNYLLVFSIISVVAITMILMNFGIMNDYVFVNLQDMSEGLASDGYISAETSLLTLAIGQAYQTTISIGDDAWFMIYIFFIIITLTYAYKVRDENEISFFLVLFNGVILFLFLASLVGIFTDWFIENITSSIIPNALSYFPKYSWYVEYTGIINGIHAVILLLVSKFNLGFANRRSSNQQEVQSITQSGEFF